MLLSYSFLAILRMVIIVILGDLKTPLFNGHYIHFYKRKKTATNWLLNSFLGRWTTWPISARCFPIFFVPYPEDTGRKLNVHKTYASYVRSIYVLCLRDIWIQTFSFCISRNKQVALILVQFYVIIFKPLNSQKAIVFQPFYQRIHKFISRAWKFVSSAKLRGLRTEPCGTLWFNCFHELNFQLIFILRDLLIKQL